MTDTTIIHTTHLTFPTPSPFSFLAAAHSSGWVQLLPTAWEEVRQAVRRVERLTSGRVVLLHMTDGGDHVAIEAEHEGQLSEEECEDIISTPWWMFHLDEDLSPFYALCRERGGKWERVAAEGLGRLQRSSEVFEDVVKVICTTNTQWSHTRRMVERLVNGYGEPFPGDPTLRAFPTAEAIAAAPPGQFAAAVRMGYRAAFVHALATRVATHELDLDALCDPGIPASQVRKALLKIKGVGPYAAASLLTILGRYDELAVDTAFRSFVSRAHFQGRQPTEEEAQAVYADWGRWKYLAFWFEIWEDAQRRRAGEAGGRGQ